MTTTKDEAIKTWPERIYLQWNPDELEEYPGASEDLTWCEDNIYASDVEYVRADLAATSHITPDAVQDDDEVQSAINTARCWAANKMLGGDPYEVCAVLLGEIDRLNSGITPDAAVEAEGISKRLFDSLEELRGILQRGTVSIDKIHELGADGPAEEAWRLFYDEIMPLYRAEIQRDAPEASELPPLPKPECLAPGVYAYRELQMDDHARAAITMHQSVSNRGGASSSAEKVVCGSCNGQPHRKVNDWGVGCEECSSKGYNWDCAAAEPVPTDLLRFKWTPDGMKHAADGYYVDYYEATAAKPAASEAVGVLSNPIKIAIHRCIAGGVSMGWISDKEKAAIGAFLAAPAAPTDAGVREALQVIHDTFKRDLDQGFVTRDKQYAVEIASAALKSSPQAPKTEGSGDADQT